MLPSWDPDRIQRKIPFVLGLVGGRRQGKSTAVADLLSRMSNKFDLVLCMVGSAACNPVLQALLTEHWDPRFFFSEWDPELMARLLEQQETLQITGRQREVLILIDDVILGSKILLFRMGPRAHGPASRSAGNFTDYGAPARGAHSH